MHDTNDTHFIHFLSQETDPSGLSKFLQPKGAFAKDFFFRKISC